jgi:hypothetical protein
LNFPLVVWSKQFRPELSGPDTPSSGQTTTSMFRDRNEALVSPM